MEYIYTAMLLHKLGKPINEENVKAVLHAAGAQINEAKIKALVAALKDVNIEEAIKEAAVAPVAQVAEKHHEEKKKEEKVDEAKAAAGLGALFG